jgi:2-methylisocitrate lyase-like PEP mutase family enzyme
MSNHDPATTRRRAATFRRLHEERSGFVMPNAWDAGSAIMLAQARFPAIATTSGGIAFSLGRADYLIPEGSEPVSRARMFDRIREITAAVDIPVNGDLEYGYGESPETVAETIRLAIEAGLAGGNIEDHAHGVLFDEALAVERIAAAREVVDASGSGFFLTARTDGLLLRPSAPLADSIHRANRYRQAGADCLYVTGVNDPEVIADVVRDIDAPLNAVMGLGDTTLTVGALRSAGVARISLGGSIARAVMGFIRDSARELMERGTLSFAQGQIPQAELNAVFAKRHATQP